MVDMNDDNEDNNNEDNDDNDNEDNDNKDNNNKDNVNEDNDNDNENNDMSCLLFLSPMSRDHLPDLSRTLGLVKGCSHIMSAKIRGSWTPTLPCQQLSAFGLPPL